MNDVRTWLWIVSLGLLLGCAKANGDCQDQDGDGYGDFCARGADCNESVSSIHPDATELCNAVDDDCDGVIDDGCIEEVDASTPDAGGSDGGAGDRDAGDRDGGARDAGGLDGGPDDAGDLDDGGIDTDAAMHDAGVDGGPAPLPETCTASAECGAHATCNTGVTPSRCLCAAGYAPCGGACCEITIAREIELPETGHDPELGFDAAGNAYVLYKRGSASVRLARIAPDGTTHVESVATSSGRMDDADLVVAPDGTVYVGVHVDIGSRSGDLVLYTRAPGATEFTSLSLIAGGRSGFAYDAAISLSRAPNGDLYGATSERSGDGTAGLYVARFDASVGAWTSVPRILGTTGHRRSELFARDDGFYVGTYTTDYSAAFHSLDETGAYLRFLATTAGTVYGPGQDAGALTDDGRLFTYTIGTLALSDGSIAETVTFPATAGGSIADLDMAVDRYGNPVLVTHSTTHRRVALSVRMPLGGGYSGTGTFESLYVPFPTTSERLTLDCERTPEGHVAFVAGDLMDRGVMRYIEYAY